MTNHKSKDQIKQLLLQLITARLHYVYIWVKNVYTFPLIRVKYYATDLVWKQREWPTGNVRLRYDSPNNVYRYLHKYYHLFGFVWLWGTRFTVSWVIANSLQVHWSYCRVTDFISYCNFEQCERYNIIVQRK